MAIRFTSSGPPLSEKELVAAEINLGVAFPASYRGFLATQNGGVPRPKTLTLKDGDELSVEWFRSIGAKRFERDLLKSTATFREELQLPKGLLPIASTEHDDVLLLATNGKSSGRIVWWKMIEEGYDRDRTTPLFKTFDELMKALEQPASSPRSDLKKAFKKIEEAILQNDLAKVRRLAEEMDLSRAPKGAVHPIFAALMAQNVEAVRLLLETGAPVDCRNLAGDTPLEDAQSTRNIAAFALDLAKKGSPHVNRKKAEREFELADTILQELQKRA